MVDFTSIKRNIKHTVICESGLFSAFIMDQRPTKSPVFLKSSNSKTGSSTTNASHLLSIYCYYNLLPTNHLLPHGSTPITSLGNPQEPREIGTVLVFFFPTGEGSCLVLKTASTDQRDIPPGFVQVLVQWYIAPDQNFSVPFYVILMPHFNIMLLVFILLPKVGLFVTNFMPFTQGI